MGKFSVDDTNYFIYRARDDSIFLHYIKTHLSQFTPEEKKKWTKGDFVEAHDRYELIYLITGKVAYSVDGVEYPLNNGDMLIIPPGKIHRRIIGAEEDYERYNIQFHRNLISSPSSCLNSILDDLLDIGNEYLLYFPKNIVEKYGLDKKIRNFDNFQNYGQNKDIVLISYILDLAIQINNAMLNEHFVEQTDMFDTKNQRIALRKIIDYVDQNLYSKIKLDDIANALYMNKYYLSHYFRKKMGVSLKQYVNMKKIFHADFLINNGSSPTAVAIQLGYTNYSTFYYAYKKYFNREPSKLKPYIENPNKK